jgi:hypothetical protein
MKNILKYLGVFLLISSMVSCEDENTIRIPTDMDKGPNLRVQLDQGFLFIDFDDLAGAKSKFDVFSQSENLALVEISVFHISVDGVVSDTATVKSYTQADIDTGNGQILGQEVTAQAMVDAIGLVGGLASLQGGDSFNFLNTTTLDNGVVYPSITVNGNSNVTPNIVAASGTTSFTSGWTLFVGCPSDLEAIEGEYTSVIVSGNYFTGQTNDNVTIAFQGPEPFRYVISDVSALAYVPFGGAAYPGDFYDICGNPQGLATSTFGTTTDTGGGTWDPVNGVLTLNYFESNNALSWQIVFTKK